MAIMNIKTQGPSFWLKKGNNEQMAVVLESSGSRLLLPPAFVLWTGQNPAAIKSGLCAQRTLPCIKQKFSSSSTAPYLLEKDGNKRRITVVNSGANVTLSCPIRTSGQNTKLQYFWRKNYKKLDFFRPKVAGIRQRSLTIKGVKRKDKGWYTCVVKNNCGRKDYTTILLVNAAPKFKTPQDNLGKRVFAVIIGNSVKLDCSADGYPRPTATWYKDGKKIYWRRETTVLRLKNLVLSNTGSYSCNVSNPYGWINRTFRVVVYAAPKFTDNLEQKVVAGIVGYSINLDCTADGNPLPITTWYKNGKIIKRRRKTSMLILKDLIPSDTGSYSCNVSNPHGSITRTFKVDVYEKIRSVPKISIIWKQRGVIYPGTDLQLHCIVESLKDIETKFRWYFSDSFFQDEDNLGALINQTLFESQLQTSPNSDSSWLKWKLVLNLKNLSVADSGSYSCQAENFAGIHQRQTYLNVTARAITSSPAGKKTHDAIVPGIVSASVLITVAVLIVIYWRRHSRIKRSLKLSVLLSKHKFEYDAFVIFSSQDLDWVIKTLIPTLEEKHQFKCCVHYRDFVVGVPFRENMVNSVYKSRKTIAVVSKNFFNSNYCGCEMEYALYRLLERKDDSVVVIVIDDVDRGKLPKELRKRSYIDYQKNVEKDHWERKLVNSLTISNNQP